MSEQSGVTNLSFEADRVWDAFVVGRAGLDLYPEPDGCQIKDALSFSSDMGGSAGNIAVAMAKAGAKVGLISALSKDGVGDFVKARLISEGVDISLTSDTLGNERTSLALAEVRKTDCGVVIYRNDPADLKVTCSDAVKGALPQSRNLVITGTSLIDIDSRAQTLEMMRLASASGCHVWLDLDYRSWNWPSLEITRQVYLEAAQYATVVIGNEEEFAVLCDSLDSYIDDGLARQKIVVLKRGMDGASLYVGNARLDCGVYAVETVKPYGAGDAFLGNLIVNYMSHGDWRQAADAGSAAAAIVVSKRGCASAMPNSDQLKSMQRSQIMTPAAHWS
ncbi:MAG: hypothetical protein GKR96_04395 [Gammaproteobacteria bacterium]|nr:hypothetical protein [Gammaproteobacteria bacterium]